MVEWWWTPRHKSGATRDDFSHLPPKIRAFLEEQAPIRPSDVDTTKPRPAPEPARTKAERYGKYGAKYADLWAGYRTPTEVEREGRTSSQAVADVYTSFNLRRRAIGTAALDNCSQEQLDVYDCYKYDFKVFGACTRTERKLYRCFETQMEFLKKMGYMSDLYRDPEVDERIQAHSDRLWQEQRVKLEELEKEQEAKTEARNYNKDPPTPEELAQQRALVQQREAERREAEARERETVQDPAEKPQYPTPQRPMAMTSVEKFWRLWKGDQGEK